MTSEVEQLAARPCPDCKGSGKGGINTMGNHYNCPTCNGTGALVPLRRECPGGTYPAFSPLKPSTMDGPMAVACRTVNRKSWRTDKWVSECIGGCQGRGWVLIPEAEQRQVMEDWALEQCYTVTYIPVSPISGEGPWVEMRFAGGVRPRYFVKGQITEALAAAINQGAGGLMKPRLRCDMPDWAPLERLFKTFKIPAHTLGHFMFMGTFSAMGRYGGSIRAYKHIDTRRYLHLDCSRAYVYCGEEGFRRIPKREALDRVWRQGD